MQLDEILAAIQTLTPEQRRRLLRRMQATGLLEPEMVATDQRRVTLAPALGVARAAAMRRRGSQSAAPAKSALTVPPAPNPRPAPDSRPTAAHDDAYRSPVSGRVVLGAPSSAVRDDDPHAMSPLPGHAPDRAIEIIFDGGSRGNPGYGYGSYALRWPGAPQQIVQLKFGEHVTNNEAEYDTLIAALEATLKRLRDAGADPATARLTARGDSLLVINQVTGEWQCKEARLRTRMTRVRELLRQFQHWDLIHHRREKSVEVLGH